MQTMATVSKKLPESQPAHSVAVVALPHRLHLIIRHGAGHIPFVYCSHSPLAASEIILQNSISTIFAGFFRRTDFAQDFM